MLSITWAPQLLKDAIEGDKRVKVIDPAPSSGMRHLSLDETGQRKDLRNIFIEIQKRIANCPNHKGALRDEELRVSLVFTHQCCVKLNKKLSIWNVSFWVNHVAHWLWTGFERNSMYRAENLYRETVELRDACEAIQKAAAAKIVVHRDLSGTSENRKAYHAFIQSSWKGSIDEKISLRFLEDDLFNEDLQEITYQDELRQIDSSRKTAGFLAIVLGGAHALLSHTSRVTNAVDGFLSFKTPFRF